MGTPLFAVIFQVFTVVMLLIIAQAFYKKSRRFSLIIFSLTVLLSIYFIYSSNTRCESFGDEAQYQYVGTFNLEISQSNFDGVDLKDYSNLLLIVKDDKTFAFSYQAPFFRYSLGHWQHMDDGDISWTEISMGNKELMQADIKPDKWIFSGQQLMGNKNSNAIIFVRQ